MRLHGWLIALALGAWPAIGHAEKVHTNANTKLYAHAGEQATVVLKVKSGATMTVLAREGRWLKVRVQGRTGYVPRSKVDLPEGEPIERVSRRRPFVDGRSTNRGFEGEGPDDRVGADATEKDDGGDDDKGKGKKAKPKDDDDDDNGKGSKAKPATKKPKAKGKSKDKDDDDDDDGDKDKGKSKDKDDDDDKADDKAPEEQPVVHVNEKTKVYEEKDKSSAVVFKATPDDALYLDDNKAPTGKWTFVSTKDGDAGFVLTSQLNLDSVGGGGPFKRTIALDARAGFALISEGMRSTGGLTTVPDNYDVSSSAFKIALGGEVLYPYGKDYILGGDLGFGIAQTVGGIAFMGKSIGFTLYNLNLRAVGGYDLHKPSGMVIYGRLGLEYQSFQVANATDLTQNTLKLPSEILEAPTFGVGIGIPRLTQNLGLKASMDLILLGTSIQQTKNLEDGTSPSAKGVCLGGVVTYKWKTPMDLQATYDLNYMSYSFGTAPPTSMRGHTGTDTSRTDILHTLTIGITRAF